VTNAYSATSQNVSLMLTNSLICFNSLVPCSICTANSGFEDRIYQLFICNLPESQLAGSQGQSWRGPKLSVFTQLTALNKFQRNSTLPTPSFL